MDIQKHTVEINELEFAAHALDCQIDELKAEIAEKNFMSNESEEKLEDLVTKAMKLGELYAKREARAQAVPEGFVLVPKQPTQSMIETGMDGFYFPLDGGCFGNSDLACAYIAMISAAQEPAND